MLMDSLKMTIALLKKKVQEGELEDPNIPKLNKTKKIKKKVKNGNNLE